MEAGRFYAVAVGRRTGIYQDWQEARRQVDGYSGGMCKKFGTKQAAENYLRRHGVIVEDPPTSFVGNTEIHEDNYFVTFLGPFSGICTLRKTAQELAQGAQVCEMSTFAEAERFLGSLGMMVNPQGRMRPEGSWVWAAYRRGKTWFECSDPENSDTLVAFCDGSAIRNGEYDCIAAYACIFPHNRHWDVVKQVKGPFTTSNRAEYLAALEAINRANIEDPKQRKMLYIFSDSELLVNSMSKWVVDWMYDGWKKSDGSPVKNTDLLELLLEARGNNRPVVFEHVLAHTGASDWKSRWNDIADRAARKATRTAAQNAPPAEPRPRICMMPSLALFGGDPNIRTYRDLEMVRERTAMARSDEGHRGEMQHSLLD